jgi:hypothetical protein
VLGDVDVQGPFTDHGKDPWQELGWRIDRCPFGLALAKHDLGSADDLDPIEAWQGPRFALRLGSGAGFRGRLRGGNRRQRRDNDAKDQDEGCFHGAFHIR